MGGAAQHGGRWRPGVPPAACPGASNPEGAPCRLEPDTQWPHHHGCPGAGSGPWAQAPRGGGSRLESLLWRPAAQELHSVFPWLVGSIFGRLGGVLPGGACAGCTGPREPVEHSVAVEFLDPG